MATYTREQFLTDVAAEAKALKEHATNEELNNLSLKILYPDCHVSCVYGLMTGSCYSVRATELIEKCCIRYFKNDLGSPDLSNGITSIIQRVNGKTVENLRLQRRELNYMSSIEAYIYMPDACNANLIAFLRDETKELVL